MSIDGAQERLNLGQDEMEYGNMFTYLGNSFTKDCDRQVEMRSIGLLAVSLNSVIFEISTLISINIVSDFHY
ncbi:Hypothetical predicted protein [Octopus vulgaris]|uniref:Uncharacterized protein n=1 Tax=Octopus vulgaris TaxID=6645 RepID=A0AA36BT49_OCTVU|nr:Hypothetical predicted protein [Octopus vulgaris]